MAVGNIRRTLKLRFLAMGGIISILGLALMATRGIEIASVGLFLVGVILLILGLVWKKAQ